MADSSTKQERPGEKPSGWLHFDDPYYVNTAIVTFQRDQADRLVAAGFKMEPFYWTTDAEVIERLQTTVKEQRDMIQQLKKITATTIGFSPHISDELFIERIKHTMILIDRSRAKGEL